MAEHKKDYTKFLIRITYKSGAQFELWFYYCTAITKGNKLHKLKYLLVIDEGVVDLGPLYMNIDEIESIWQVAASIGELGLYPEDQTTPL